MDKDDETQWLPVIAKSLAVLAMHRAELGNSKVSERAEFLASLGVPRSDAAAMLGTTADSLRVMSAQKKKKGAKRGKA